MNKYKEIEFGFGNIESAVKELKSHNELVCGSFNGQMLYSDIDDLDSAYVKITGKTKAEFDEAERIRHEEYKEVKSKQDAIVDMLSDKLNSYPKGEFGMTEEIVRMSDEYKALKLQYAKEFRKIQDINSFGMKNFKKEIYKEHEEKRKQRRTS